MKPIVLMMQAFGPYANQEIIDFRQLGNHTMFVISGKTGAGKTTIFDGISYAIYGRASGEDRVGPDLRSQFSDEDIQTEVSLQFELRGKQYYIWRAPQQEKKKTRGEGYTTVNAKAELYLVENGEKQIIGSNVKEVDEKIKEIMQIDVNQFRQILMIPQGEFRKLLVSESKEKEIILQRLFHTFAYKKVEEALKDQASLLREQVGQFSRQKLDLMRMIDANNNEELRNQLLSEEINEVIIISLLEEEIDRKVSQIKSDTKLVQDKEKERDTLHTQWIQATQILETIKRKEQLEVWKIQLDEKEPIIQEKQQTIEKAQKAEKLLQQELKCHSLKRDLDEKAKQINQLNEKINDQKQQLAQKEKILQEEKGKEQERKEASEYVQKLKSMQEDVFAYSGWVEEFTELKRQLEKIHQSAYQVDEAIAKNKAKLEVLQEQKESLEQLKYKRLEAKMQLDQLKNVLEQSKSLLTLDNNFKQLQISKTKTDAEGELLKRRLEDQKILAEIVDKKWVQGQAALLAKVLTEGEECPVCGSIHHPKKAIQHEELPTEEEVKEVRNTLNDLEKEVTDFTFRQQKLVYEMDSIIEKKKEIYTKLSHEVEAVEIENNEEFYLRKKNELQAKHNQLAEWEKLLQRLDGTIALVRETEGNIESLLKKKDQINEEERKLEKAITEKQVMIQRIKDSIPKNIQSKELFMKELNQSIQKEEALWKRLEKAQEEYAEAKEQASAITGKMETLEVVYTEISNHLALEKQQFVDMMNEEGFANYTDYENGKRTIEQMKQLENEIISYREEYRSVSDQLEQLELVLKDSEKPNIEELEQRLKISETELDRLRAKLSDLQSTWKKNQEIYSTILSINSKVKDLEEEFKLVGHLADIARGQNAQRITFERYVLASFLDDILKLANARLLKMTSGRYTLLRKKDRSKGNVQSGLELLIYDQYTGQERHVKTLSGGESFKAALSLALGLADVVQEYAGGVSLETMFIDEGFGTLDPESLDHAIEALMEIQSSGRLVGIISHVPELKERMDVRLEVIATQEGSRTEFKFYH
ncbi:SMC family ATPase [Caldibacillus lycopersici]|uniref:Nuclease SbcCD subunit C n=1 Tax=Perspicuibacillus lycopersici TaxID=1325689 RepID=A0AAE3LP40_9BACI|nr:SMC family ATPase [Perspicuibacillus lycopersici]MCU9611949.1 SMC family ATPase [Perspicuibacillus lycopersici]